MIMRIMMMMVIFIFSGRSRETQERRQRDANSTTMMLVVVIAVFVTVEIPLSVIGLLHIISSRWYFEIVFDWSQSIFQHCGVSWLPTGQQDHPVHQCVHQPFLSDQLCHILRHVEVDFPPKKFTDTRTLQSLHSTDLFLSQTISEDLFHSVSGALETKMAKINARRRTRYKPDLRKAACNVSMIMRILFVMFVRICFLCFKSKVSIDEKASQVWLDFLYSGGRYWRYIIYYKVHYHSFESE